MLTFKRKAKVLSKTVTQDGLALDHKCLVVLPLKLIKQSEEPVDLEPFPQHKEQDQVQ